MAGALGWDSRLEDEDTIDQQQGTNQRFGVGTTSGRDAWICVSWSLKGTRKETTKELRSLLSSTPPSFFVQLWFLFLKYDRRRVNL